MGRVGCPTPAACSNDLLTSGSGPRSFRAGDARAERNLRADIGHRAGGIEGSCGERGGDEEAEGGEEEKEVKAREAREGRTGGSGEGREAVLRGKARTENENEYE